jgi:hypothetical protein
LLQRTAWAQLLPLQQHVIDEIAERRTALKRVLQCLEQYDRVLKVKNSLGRAYLHSDDRVLLLQVG